MGSEAQKLISLSLEKMATCRRRRREMSLHKNLLLTTVIHKARIAIMEETYYMMNTTATATAAYECDGSNGRVDGVVVGGPAAMRPAAVTTTTTTSSSTSSAFESPGPMLYYGCHQQQPPHYDDEQDVPMDWEGSDGSAPVLSPQSVVIVSSTSISMTSPSSSKDDDDVEDKENVCPIGGSGDGEDDEFASTQSCCEQRFGACRSADCQFLRSNGSSGHATTHIGVGHKRLMMDILMDSGDSDDDDDDMAGGDEQKKLKWDVMMDPDSDTSHALRLVSVLSATLSSSGSTTTTTTTSLPSRPPSPPPRLVKSISSPDLCSKQAKDAMDGRAVDRPVMAIAV